jgi:hypothetical protein
MNQMMSNQKFNRTDVAEELDGHPSPSPPANKEGMQGKLEDAKKSVRESSAKRDPSGKGSSGKQGPTGSSGHSGSSRSHSSSKLGNGGNLGSSSNGMIQGPHFSNGASASTNATDLLRTSLIKFFSKRENIDRFLPIINRTSPVSLRLLDYFCVNYTRITQVAYMMDEEPNKYFDVHSNYKNQLKTFSKRLFDPFKRNTRETIRYGNETFDTTLGQLSFFKWCLTNKVLDYVEKNIAFISEDMKKNCGKGPEDLMNNGIEKKRRSSKRRSAMNVSATRVPCTPGTTSVVVSFD